MGAEHLLSDVEKLQGREISFNNLYDLDAARTLLADLTDFGAPAAVIVKHANPCGAAVGESVADAYRKALASDPQSAFGGIVALSGDVDGELAAEISKVFTEILVAPAFTGEAQEVLSSKPNVRVLVAGPLVRPLLSTKQVTGGILLQDADAVEDDSDYRVVTEAHLTEQQMEDLLFAWRVARVVKSNAIVLAREGATVGVGAGQMSRVDSSEIAVKKAAERARGSVAASDAFFPFADGVEALAKAGIAPSSSPAAPCATTRSLKPRTARDSRWSSPDGAISCIEARLLRRLVSTLRLSARSGFAFACQHAGCAGLSVRFGLRSTLISTAPSASPLGPCQHVSVAACVIRECLYLCELRHTKSA